MGEIVLSSDDEEVTRRGKRVKRNEGMVKWERFLPRMVLRVLLVEADDSTRQIIAALLRKCSYKVVAVSDGLKAWEAIKGRPNDIDLILTEVDLPSISGFALLTLIMEHKACKNIPVIMMSSHDSVNMVYKCMLRGAADSLTKPIRRNELKNLWQHVWRRQSVHKVTSGAHNESIAQRKTEASSENDEASSNSSGSMDCSLRKNKRRVNKESDSQSSCTKPDMEAESTYMENIQDIPQSKRIKSTTINNLQTEEKRTMLMRESVAQTKSIKSGSDAVNSKIDDVTAQTEEPERKKNEHNVVLVHVNSSREAIDLIGAFDNQGKSSHGNICPIDGLNKSEIYPHLDLSLKRYQLTATENQVNDEHHSLNHSSFSPFSRYQSLNAFHSAPTSISNQHEELGCGSNKLEGSGSDKRFSNLLPSYNSDSSCPTHLTQKSVLSFATNQSEQTNSVPYHQPRPFPVPVQVQGISFDSACKSYGSVLAQIFTAQSGNRNETLFQVNPIHDQLDQSVRNFTKQGAKSSLEDGRVSPTTDGSANSSFCNGGNETLQTHDESSRRSVLREAALTKFRMKRKERCYEKKVRYESRKKLAEQRPRVKGQFVRQAHIDHSPAETNNYSHAQS